MRCHVANIVAAALTTSTLLLLLLLPWLLLNIGVQKVFWMHQCNEKLNAFFTLDIWLVKKAHSSHDCEYFVVVFFFLNFFLFCFVFSFWYCLFAVLLFLFSALNVQQEHCVDHMPTITLKDRFILLSLLLLLLLPVYLNG